MAKQVGPIFITGTIDGIIFYKLGNTYYLRSKGDYKSAKRMRKDPNLKRTMANADQFGIASKIVKYPYYRNLPKEVRKFGLFAKLTGMVKRWLQEGKSKEEAKEALIEYMQTLIPKNPTEATTTVRETLPVLPPKPMPAPMATKPKPAVTKPASFAKQSRYLSNWKVKRNGRLHIPKSAITLSSIQPVVPSITQPLKE
ncbi:hypothetical protein [Flavisolibacter tropicus]|uniref:Uncharacterized protein n=1 Tax=Flavisolibacter tropicus TaxID=1492898 RepID=A0A172TR70_9BACT|nr:hypothetical protein [Flavisolibacter tropicus]ANE49498.1 hypothetical protein SY85_02265 [Flavisolibacter tropicus]